MLDKYKCPKSLKTLLSGEPCDQLTCVLKYNTSLGFFVTFMSGTAYLTFFLRLFLWLIQSSVKPSIDKTSS